ncbi:hypothetical protein ACVWY3_003233 [Bradyrhizobium sp. USDA 4486]
MATRRTETQQGTHARVAEFFPHTSLNVDQSPMPQIPMPMMVSDTKITSTSIASH